MIAKNTTTWSTASHLRFVAFFLHIAVGMELNLETLTNTTSYADDLDDIDDYVFARSATAWNFGTTKRRI